MNKTSEKGRGQASGLKKSEQRDIAKAGMIASLGTLVVTGLIRFKGSWMLHTWAGLFLVGFSVWHHLLNQPDKARVPKRVRRPAKRTGQGEASS